MVPSDQIEHSHEYTEPALPYQWFVGIHLGSETTEVCVLDRDRHRVGARKGLSMRESLWLSAPHG